MPTLRPEFGSDDYSDGAHFSNKSLSESEKDLSSMDDTESLPKERGDSSSLLDNSDKLQENVPTSGVFFVDPLLPDVPFQLLGNGNSDSIESLGEKFQDESSVFSSYADVESLDTVTLQQGDASNSKNSIESMVDDITCSSLDSNFQKKSMCEENDKTVGQGDASESQHLGDSLKVHVNGSNKSMTFETSNELTSELISSDNDKLESTDYTVNETTEHEKDASSDETGTSSDSLEWMDILGSGDLMKKVIVPGLGKETRPDRGQIVTVNIAGRLDDGRIVEYCERLRFTVGDAEVVQGLDLALPLMEKGEKAEVIIKPRFAYDTLGKQPEIPSNTTITYSVELLNVEDVPELEQMSLKERLTVGNQKREKGNFWYGRGDYSQAVLCYRRAIDFLDDENQNFSEPPEELQELLEARMKVYNNIAAAQLKIEAYDAALKSIDTVLKVQPDNVKALFRKGKILAAQGNLNDAILCMSKALHLEPETKVIHQELTRLKKKKKTQNKLEKDMYRRMLGQKLNEEKNNKSRSSTTLWGAILGGIAAVVIGVFVYRQYHGGL